jgi:signal transduction histidine kinase
MINSGHHPSSFFRTMWRTIGNGGVWRNEVCNRTKKGDLYWVDTTIVPLTDDKGKPLRYLAIRHDVTASKRDSRRLQDLNALAQLGRAAAALSHEIRNPLAGISGALQIIGRRIATDYPDEFEIIQDVLGRLDDMSTSVSEWLDFARPVNAPLRRLDVADLLKHCLNQMATDPLFSAIQLETSVPEQQTFVMGNRAHLSRAVQNLLINAAQAMDGRGAITANLRSVDETVVLEILDEGPGLTLTAEEAIQPFVSTKSNGTGLGLALVHRTMLEHNGELVLRPRPAGGLSVALVWPSAEVESL